TKKVSDLRRVFDRPNDFDAVVVSTAEHTHAFATYLALTHGKHVYCEKPLAYNIWETRLIRETAAKYPKLSTQMGNQGHASPARRMIKEILDTGMIGPVREVHVWADRAWGLQDAASAEKLDKPHGFYYGIQIVDRFKEEMPSPSNMHWDLWLGPAPERPYHATYFPGPRWYRWWDFGNGTMSDLGSHWNDLPFWAMKLDAPKTIEAIGPDPHPEIAPASMTTIYEYGPRGDMPACKLTWYQGTHKPQIWKDKAIPQYTNGVLFIGSKGRMLLADYSKYVLLPEAEFKDFQRPEKFIMDGPTQQQEWLLAIKNGTPTGSPFNDY